ncbi:MAG: caspase domain-containing protein, partial [Hyphomicrobiaceae bacterium]|nr:caspase domain-containing protein [Hyphomicrobiaceae bacterium]
MAFATAAPVGVAPKRVALVIGNSAYEHSTPLVNPRNDAVAISKVLQELGFHVITSLDAKYRDLPKALGEFERKLRSAEVGLLYYSGHGLQIEGRNFLVPVDADINTEIDVQFQAVRLDRILNVMQNGPKITLVFLDACRNNPLARRLARRLKTRSSIIGRGLARIRAQSGMLVAYATAPGDVAQDGTGKYSPFTTAMLKHVKTPGLDISPMLRRVRRDVMKETGAEQVPWTNSSLTFDFVFSPKGAGETIAKPDAGARVGAGAGTGARANNAGTKSSEQYAWEATAKVGTCGAYKHFYTSYPQSFYAGLAKSWVNGNCAKSAPKPEIETPPEQFAMLSPLRDEPVGKSLVEPGPDLKELARDLQSELKRVGCLNGRADGIWGVGSRRAAAEFNRVASRQILPDQPSLEAIDVVRSAQRSTCRLQP